MTSVAGCAALKPKPCRCPRAPITGPASCPAISIGALPKQPRVVVAAQDIKAGTKLKTSLLTVAKIARHNLRAGFLRPVDIVHFSGRRTLRLIREGRPIHRRDVEGFQAGKHTWITKVRGRERAVTMKVDWVAGSGVWARSGDRVDISGIARRNRGLTIYPIVHNARVLAAERWISPRAPTAPRARWLTVAALPQEARALQLAQRVGRLVITLRGLAPDRSARYPPVTRRDLTSPAFWRRLVRQRRLLRHRSADDPGIGTK